MGLAGFVTFMWYIYRTIKNSVIGIYNSSLTLKTILAAGTAALWRDFGDVAGGVQLVLSKSDGYVLGALGIIAAATYLAELKNRRLSEMD